MSAKLKLFGDSFGSKLLSAALLLCGIEIAVLLLAIVIDLLVDHRLQVVVRANAISWLVCGFGSIAFATTALVKGPKRGTAAWVLLVSLAVFILCAARFAIV